MFNSDVLTKNAYMPFVSNSLAYSPVPMETIEDFVSEVYNFIDANNKCKRVFVSSILNRHLTDTYVNHLLLQDSYAKLYYIWQRETNVEFRKNLATIISIDVDQCSSGHHDRVNSFIIAWDSTFTLPALLQDFRHKIIAQTASLLAEEEKRGGVDVHAYNSFFIVGKDLGLGVPIPQETDEYSGHYREEFIRDVLKSAFTENYRPLKIFTFIVDAIRDELETNYGYKGKSTYAIQQKRKWLCEVINVTLGDEQALTVAEAIKCFVDEQSLEATEDLNWPLIHDRLLNRLIAHCFVERPEYNALIKLLQHKEGDNFEEVTIRQLLVSNDEITPLINDNYDILILLRLCGLESKEKNIIKCLLANYFELKKAASSNDYVSSLINMMRYAIDERDFFKEAIAAQLKNIPSEEVVNACRGNLNTFINCLVFVPDDEAIKYIEAYNKQCSTNLDSYFNLSQIYLARNLAHNTYLKEVIKGIFSLCYCSPLINKPEKELEKYCDHLNLNHDLISKEISCLNIMPCEQIERVLIATHNGHNLLTIAMRISNLLASYVIKMINSLSQESQFKILSTVASNGFLSGIKPLELALANKRCVMGLLAIIENFTQEQQYKTLCQYSYSENYNTTLTIIKYGTIREAQKYLIILINLSSLQKQLPFSSTVRKKDHENFLECLLKYKPELIREGIEFLLNVDNDSLSQCYSDPYEILQILNCCDDKKLTENFFIKILRVMPEAEKNDLLLLWAQNKCVNANFLVNLHSYFEKLFLNLCYTAPNIILNTFTFYDDTRDASILAYKFIFEILSGLTKSKDDTENLSRAYKAKYFLKLQDFCLSLKAKKTDGSFIFFRNNVDAKRDNTAKGLQDLLLYGRLIHKIDREIIDTGFNTLRTLYERIMFKRLIPDFEFDPVPEEVELGLPIQPHNGGLQFN